MNNERFTQIVELVNKYLKSINNPYRDELNTNEQIKSKFKKQLKTKEEEIIFDTLAYFKDIETFRQVAMRNNNKTEEIIKELHIPRSESYIVDNMKWICSKYQVNNQNNDYNMNDTNSVSDKDNLDKEADILSNKTTIHSYKNTSEVKDKESKLNNSNDITMLKILLENAENQKKSLKNENFNYQRKIEQLEQDNMLLKQELESYKETIDLIRILINKKEIDKNIDQDKKI